MKRNAFYLNKNFQVNDYIVMGRWQPPFDDGTLPSKWTGSVPILTEYLKTLKIVRYGQCWVFSGVLTTLMRALGIPSRSVTCLGSAHDTDQTLTVDEHFVKHPETGRFESAGKEDSIWNFHVWIEAWMKRHDLNPGYDGWQVCDATPQEQSQGK